MKPMEKKSWIFIPAFLLPQQRQISCEFVYLLLRSAQCDPKIIQIDLLCAFHFFDEFIICSASLRKIGEISHDHI